MVLYDLFATPLCKISPKPAPKSSNAGNFLASDMFRSRVTEDGLLQLMITRVGRLCEAASQASFRPRGVHAIPCIPMGQDTFYSLLWNITTGKIHNSK